MKKILIFSIAYYPLIGGAEVSIKEITDRINDIQFDMVTLRFDKSHPKFEKIGNVSVYRVGGGKLLYPFAACIKATALHKKNNYDAVWSMMAAFAGFAALFFKSFHPRVPFLLTLQEGDSIADIKKKVRFIYPLFAQIFTRADFVQVISSYLGKWARQMGFKGPLEIVPNGVNVAHFSQKYPQDVLNKLKNELGKTANDKYLVTASRLVKKNAVDDVIKSLTYLPENIKFLVLGSGPDLGTLQKSAKELGVAKRVRFLGLVGHKEMPKYLKISDIFIRPSLSEGFGNSFVEAMAAGVPVIATPVGGIVDFLRDRETGLFCNVRDPKSIAEKVRLLLKDNELRRKIVSKAQKMVEEKYDWNLIAQKMHKIFNRICG